MMMTFRTHALRAIMGSLLCGVAASLVVVAIGRADIEPPTDPNNTPGEGDFGDCDGWTTYPNGEDPPPASICDPMENPCVQLNKCIGKTDESKYRCPNNECGGYCAYYKWNTGIGVGGCIGDDTPGSTKTCKWCYWLACADGFAYDTKSDCEQDIRACSVKGWARQRCNLP